MECCELYSLDLVIIHECYILWTMTIKTHIGIYSYRSAIPVYSWSDISQSPKLTFRRFTLVFGRSFLDGKSLKTLSTPDSLAKFTSAQPSILGQWNRSASAARTKFKMRSTGIIFQHHCKAIIVEDKKLFLQTRKRRGTGLESVECDLISCSMLIPSTIRATPCASARRMRRASLVRVRWRDPRPAPISAPRVVQSRAQRVGSGGREYTARTFIHGHGAGAPGRGSKTPPK